jgi:predicted permease
MATVVQDVRFACRTLWSSRGFAAVAILCLGLGIGLNTTIFSIADGVLLKPFPYEEPDRLLVLGSRHPQSDSNAGLSYKDLVDWKAGATSLASIGGVSFRSLTVSDGAGEPERYAGAGISWDLFPLLGVAPTMGRGFVESDDRPGGGGVVLISHDLWTVRYQAAPDILGLRMLVDGTPHAIVGVMPEGFRFPDNQRLWVPIAPLVADAPRSNRGLFAFGRLRPSATTEQVTQELSGVAAGLARAYPATNDGWTVRPRTLRDAFIGDEVRQVLALMMAAVTLVLFIACSNVANLLLARASQRGRELAVRASLGAGRGRIVRQLLTESVVLGVASVPPGLLIAQAGTKLIAWAIPPDQVPYFIHWAVDARSLAYSIAIATATALVFGLVPAVHVTRGRLCERLVEGSRGNTARRSLLRSTLVAAQVALALVALVGALLFVRSFGNIERFHLGFDTARLLTLRVAMSGPSYEEPDARLRRVEDIVQRVEALPGVEAVFASGLVPLAGGGGGGDLIIEGRPVEPGGRPGIGLVGATPRFFDTLGVALLAGRGISRVEGFSRAPVAVVNETMAKRFWPDGSTIGARFRLDNDGPDASEWFTIVGVAPDLSVYGVSPGNVEPDPMAFVPYAYQQVLNTGLTIRVAGDDPLAAATAVREAIRASDPYLPLYQLRTMEDARRLGFWEFGLYRWIFGVTGAVGLLLASVGVYGVLSYSVAQRTQEIGVRMALGAGRRDVMRLVVRQGLWLSGIGVAAGLLLAAIATPSTRSFLFQVSPFDPASFAGVAVVLMAVAWLASWVPARRATRVDPIVVLRGE